MGKAESITIGQMAELFGISQQTLRLYDQIGLLKPYYIDPANNYRYYNLKQSAKLDIILYLKNLGMTLTQIKEVFDAKDLYLLQAKLKQGEKHIEQQLTNLELQKQGIRRTIQTLDYHKTCPLPGIITIEKFSPRYAFTIDYGVNVYEHDYARYELMLSQLRADIVKHGIPKMFYFNPGSILRRSNLIHRQFRSTELFVFVDQKYADQSAVEVFPAGKYLCIYCNRFEHEVDYIKRLLRVIEQEQYRVVGDYICESINDILLYDDYEGQMSLRLQIPIQD